MDDGGNDGLQVSVAVFAIVLSLVVTMMVPILAPDYSDDRYDYQDIMAERMAVEGFTGESMVSQTPWILTGVYTPYIEGKDYGTTPEGWLYGTAITDKSGYQYIGESQGIKLDPNQKSNIPLDSHITHNTITTEKIHWIWQNHVRGGNGPNLLYQIAHFVNPGIELYEKESQDLPSWNYSGYRYEFDPMLMINTSTSPEQVITSDDAKLSIVWYDSAGQQGISGGLVLYSEKTKAIIANYPAADIIREYNVNSSFASKYPMSFDGVKINLNIKFDTSVISAGKSLEEAWTNGQWSLAFTALSGGDLMDIKNSNSLDLSVGNIITTYSQIFTFDVPNLPGSWSFVLWILCILPVEITMLMFLSRFGITGVGLGILGNVLLGVL